MVVGVGWRIWLAFDAEFAWPLLARDDLQGALDARNANDRLVWVVASRHREFKVLALEQFRRDVLQLQRRQLEVSIPIHVKGLRFIRCKQPLTMEHNSAQRTFPIVPCIQHSVTLQAIIHVQNAMLTA